MAGNVKEWCWNESGSGRMILGGAWNEPGYMFDTVDSQLPFQRLPQYRLQAREEHRAAARPLL